MKTFSLLLIILSALTVTNALWPIYFYGEDSNGYMEEAEEAQEEDEEEESVIGSEGDDNTDGDDDDSGQGGEEEGKVSGGDNPKSDHPHHAKGSKKDKEKKTGFVKAPLSLKGYGTIACYCYDFDHPLFLLDYSTRVAGEIELRGNYDEQGKFQPRGFEGIELSTVDYFGRMCDKLFKVCRRSDGCWADQSPLKRNSERNTTKLTL